MSVFKKYQGKRITAKDKNWSKGTWYVWKRINGKIIHKSIPEAQTKEQAEYVERRYIEAAYNARYGVADTATRFDQFCLGAYKRYVDQSNVNRGAKDLYCRLLIKRFGQTPLSEITPQDCRDAQHYFKTTKATKADKLSPSSVNRIMSTLSKIFTLACEEGILDRNPMQYVKMLKEPPPRSRLLTSEEKERLWEALATDILLFRFVLLAVNMPLRLGQLLAITPDAIDLQSCTLITTPSKGRSSRLIPLNHTAVNTLQLMLSEKQLPFPLKDIRKRWNRITQAAGINVKGGKRGTNFTFHDLRKEFASELIRKNVNPNIIQKLFAHSDMAITNIYMHSEMDELKAAVNTLDATESQIQEKIDGPLN